MYMYIRVGGFSPTQGSFEMDVVLVGVALFFVMHLLAPPDFHVRTCANVCVCVSICLFVCLCVCVWGGGGRLHICACVCVCVCVCVCKCSEL